MKKLSSTTDPLWYKDAVIYEIHVRAFADSNDDGIGDFQGLISKLDYLQDLGVTCIWLLPFFPSPLRDDGYDISNYVGRKSFLRNAGRTSGNSSMPPMQAQHASDDRAGHKSHQSDQHPWFQKAAA